VRDGDHYVLTGTKTFVTNAPVADLAVVYATIDPKLGARPLEPVPPAAGPASSP
jgi:alkylation response protein AidB-like acyl-CoA dehydrogenase